MIFKSILIKQFATRRFYTRAFASTCCRPLSRQFTTCAPSMLIPHGKKRVAGVGSPVTSIENTHNVSEHQHTCHATWATSIDDDRTHTHGRTLRNANEKALNRITFSFTPHRRGTNLFKCYDFDYIFLLRSIPKCFIGHFYGWTQLTLTLLGYL